MFQVFVCQTVSGKSYLRWGYVSYGSLWVLGYAVGFPVWLWIFLHRNHEEIEAHYHDLLSPFYKQFGFIWNDYRQVVCITANCCKHLTNRPFLRRNIIGGRYNPGFVEM